jgi:hypothetical protein
MDGTDSRSLQQASFDTVCVEPSGSDAGHKLVIDTPHKLHKGMGG